MSYPFKSNGYIYSKGTKKGFLRMQRMGIPRPLFSIQDRLAKVAKSHYRELVRRMLKDIKVATASCGVTMDSAPVDGEDETLERLIEFFTSMQKQQELENQKLINQANMAAVENTLQNEWADGGQNVQLSENGKKVISNILQKEQDDYLLRLFNDAGDKMQQILASFSLDKQEIFNQHMEELKALYLDNSIQRLDWEQDYIKRCMLRRIHSYVTGESDQLKFDDLIKYAYKFGDNMARLFARDQMQRFNKALTLSTFVEAKVTKVKWVTCHDVRVRKTHKDLDGQIFDINNLPPEVDDYNCRCGLVPVEWAE
jgi:SPP1 gp7 family putative phage head morphogenesis protein